MGGSGFFLYILLTWRILLTSYHPQSQIEYVQWLHMSGISTKVKINTERSSGRVILPYPDRSYYKV